MKELKHDAKVVQNILNDGVFCEDLNYILDRISSEKIKLNKIDQVL